MSRVFVVSPERIPLAPCTPARARWLLTTKQAAVLRRYPLTLILLREPSGTVVPSFRLKIDPGSKTTGLAIVNDTTGQAVWAGELTHRGYDVTQALSKRRACRSSRRQRHTRYRPKRFLNRRRKPGWLPPSLESRLANVLTWVLRLQRWCPIRALSLELVTFDTQLLQDPEINGAAYQQGELAGYEIRQYLLEKFSRQCAYCGTSGVPLEVEHIVPTARGGSDRVANLTIACHACNQRKGHQTAEEFGHSEVQAQAKAPLRDAAAINATRWALYHRLEVLEVALETGSGGLTQYNRLQRGLPKAHWVDAACVGASTPPQLRLRGVVPWTIRAAGRHSRQMCRTNECGFPDKAPKATSVVGGFRTGDLVRAQVPASSKKAGTYVGRIAIRASGSCNIQRATGPIQGIHYRYCRPLQRADGYTYAKGARAVLPTP
ncbi:MAG: HNH endonuclease [Chloroflexi bacterium]|nr:MAG: HNH endonuclease [Chloroflexota bacterium]